MRQDAADRTHIPARSVRARIARGVHVLAWLYLIAAIVLGILLRTLTDRWWPVTLVAFGPRWVFLLPMIALVPAAIAFRRPLQHPKAHADIWSESAQAGASPTAESYTRVLRKLARLLLPTHLTPLPLIIATAIVIVGPVMGFAVPWRTWLPRANSANSLTIRVMTYSLQSGQTDAAALRQYILDTNPDVIVIQEWSPAYAHVIPADRLPHSRQDGELFIATRFPIERVHDIAAGRWGGIGSAVRYDLRTPHGVVPVINLRLASPHTAFEAAIHRAPGAAKAVTQNSALRAEQSRIIAQAAKEAGPLTIAAGDFNTPPESPILAPWQDLADAQSEAGWALAHTYHARRTTLRIDHIRAGTAWWVRQSHVAPDLRSPHRPVEAELVLR